MVTSAEPDLGDRTRSLLEAARNGDQVALGELMDYFRGYLLAIAAADLAPGVRPKTVPSDIVQDTFLEAYRAFARFEGFEADEFRAWLRSILQYKVSEAHSRYLYTAKRAVGRELSIDPANPDHHPADASTTPSGAASMTEEAQAVAAVLARISATDRQVIVWRKWDSLSFAEIGRRLGRSEDAARMLFARALERFQAELEPSHDDTLSD